MKLYVSWYGMVASISKKDLILLLEKFKNIGDYNLNDYGSFKNLKVKLQKGKFQCFRHGSKLKYININLTDLEDGYSEYKELTIEHINNKIKALND